MVIYAQHLATLAIKNYNQSKEDVAPPPISFISESSIHRFDQYGFMAEGEMDNAKKQIILMAHTGDYSEGLTYEAVSPEFIMALVMKGIRTRDESNKQVNIIKLYQDHLSKLVSKSNRRPRYCLRMLPYLLDFHRFC